MQIKELLASATNRLVAANIIVYFVLRALFAGEPSGLELYYWQNPEFRIWQLFSYMFLHADLMHLFFNMFGLWMFGRILERVWGGKRLLIFFLVCGLGAGAIQQAYSYHQFNSAYTELESISVSQNRIASVYQQGLNISNESAGIKEETVYALYSVYNSPAVGASGALYGILVAFALLFPNFKMMLIFLPVPIAAKYFMPVLLLIDLSAGVTGFSLFGYNIAHFAHLGGALMGFLMVQFWLRGPRI